MTTLRLSRSVLTLAPIVAALLLGSCAPPPDFPIGADVTVWTVQGGSTLGTLEHVSSDWVVLRGYDGQDRYIPIHNVTGINRKD